MADIIRKPFSCFGSEGSGNLEWENDYRGREMVLQDKLADCLFQMKPGNEGFGMLDVLLSQLDEVAPLPNDKAFDAENSLTRFYQKLPVASANPAPPAASRRRVRQPRPFLVTVVPRTTSRRPFCQSPERTISQRCVYQPFTGLSSLPVYGREVRWVNSCTCAAVTVKTIRWNEKKHLL